MIVYYQLLLQIAINYRHIYTRLRVFSPLEMLQKFVSIIVFSSSCILACVYSTLRRIGAKKQQQQQLARVWLSCRTLIGPTGCCVYGARAVVKRLLIIIRYDHAWISDNDSYREREMKREKRMSKMRILFLSLLLIPKGMFSHWDIYRSSRFAQSIHLL